MNNETIILKERVKLMREGVLKSTGSITYLETETGTVKIEEPEPIHTYQMWKGLGRQVKKGEKAISKILIWKCTKKNKKDDEKDDEKDDSKEIKNMFLTGAYFFKESQTEIMK